MTTSFDSQHRGLRLETSVLNSFLGGQQQWISCFMTSYISTFFGKITIRYLRYKNKSTKGSIATDIMVLSFSYEFFLTCQKKLGQSKDYKLGIYYFSDKHA